MSAKRPVVPTATPRPASARPAAAERKVDAANDVLRRALVSSGAMVLLQTPERGRWGRRRGQGRRAGAMAAEQDSGFKGRHFAAEVILWALRWYLAFPVSDRDLASMLSNRGVAVDHSTLLRWVQTDAATLEERVRRPLRPCTGSWRVDKTYIKVSGVWTQLDRAVDSLGQTIAFLLSARRDTGAAQRFFCTALAAARGKPGHDHGGQEPGRSACGDGDEASRRAMALLAATAVQISEHHCRAGSHVEQDHRRIKRLVRPRLGFGRMPTARRTLAGYEAMAMIRKGRVDTIGSQDMQAQIDFVAGLFAIPT